MHDVREALKAVRVLAAQVRRLERALSVVDEHRRAVEPGNLDLDEEGFLAVDVLQGAADGFRRLSFGSRFAYVCRGVGGLEA